MSHDPRFSTSPTAPAHLNTAATAKTKKHKKKKKKKKIKRHKPTPGSLGGKLFLRKLKNKRAMLAALDQGTFKLTKQDQVTLFAGDEKPIVANTPQQFPLGGLYYYIAFRKDGNVCFALVRMDNGDATFHSGLGDAFKLGKEAIIAAGECVICHAGSNSHSYMIVAINLQSGFYSQGVYEASEQKSGLEGDTNVLNNIGLKVSNIEQEEKFSPEADESLVIPVAQMEKLRKLGVIQPFFRSGKNAPVDLDDLLATNSLNDPDNAVIQKIDYFSSAERRSYAARSPGHSPRMSISQTMPALFVQTEQTKAETTGETQTLSNVAS